MNKTKNNLIKSLKVFAEDLLLDFEEQQVFVDEAIDRIIEEFDLDFNDEEGEE